MKRHHIVPHDAPPFSKSSAEMNSELQSFPEPSGVAADCSIAQVRFHSFLIFLGVFSWAHFFLMASMGLEFGVDLLSFWNLGILISALGMIMNPSRMIWVGCHAFFWIAFELHPAPVGSSHLLLMTLTSLGILTALFMRSVFGLSASRLGWEKTFKGLITFGRWQMLILLFFAVFHKLNEDFFNAEISCGVALVLDIIHHLPGLSGVDSIPAPKVVILLTLALEALIPVLLIIPRTRFWGVLIGFWFHFILSFHANLYVMSFSFEVQAMYFLFVPMEIILQGKRDWRAFTLRLRVGQFKVFGQLAVGMVALGFFGFCIWLGHSDFDQWLRRGFRLAWMGCVALVSIYMIWIRYFRQSKHSEPVVIREHLPWMPSRLLIPITLLTFLNGWTPYLGWKTSSDFSICSNLRTETSVSNHYLIRKPLGGWTSAEQMVQILDTTDPFLIRIRDLNQQGRQWYVPEVLVRRRAAESKDEQLTVVVQRLNGEIEFASRAQTVQSAFREKGWKENLELFAKVSLLELKFLDFRAIPLDGKPIPCLH